MNPHGNIQYLVTVGDWEVTDVRMNELPTGGDFAALSERGVRWPHAECIYKTRVI